jgi:hypothetical protein
MGALGVGIHQAEGGAQATTLWPPPARSTCSTPHTTTTTQKHKQTLSRAIDCAPLLDTMEEWWTLHQQQAQAALGEISWVLDAGTRNK